MDWEHVSWIWLDEKNACGWQHVVFQRDFRLEELPERAFLAVSADQTYRLRINGQWHADGPAYALPEHCSCDVMECSQLLRCGLNRIEAEVRAPANCGGFLARLELNFADGKKEIIGSDEQWLAAGIPQRRTRKKHTVAFQGEPFEFFDNSNLEPPSFAPAVRRCGAQEDGGRKLAARTTPMLTRCEALIRRVSTVCLTEKECTCIAVDRKNITVEQPDRMLICAMEFSVPGACSFVPELQGGTLWLDGTAVDPEKEIQLSSGEHFMIFTVAPDPAEDVCFAVFPAAAGILPGRKVKAFAEERAYEPAGISCMRDFFGAFPDAQILDDDLLEDAGYFSFRFGRDFPLAPGTVENVQALIYPDDRCTVIHPVEGYDIRFCCDAGCRSSGYWNFVIHAPAGTIVDISASDFDSADVHPESCSSLRYICRSGWNRFTSSIRRSGRFLFITLRNMTGEVKIQSFRLVESTFPVVHYGEFISADRVLDRKFQDSCRMLQLCMEDRFVTFPAAADFSAAAVGDASLGALTAFGAEELVRHCCLLAAEKGLSRLQKLQSGDSIPAENLVWITGLPELWQELADPELFLKIYPAVQQQLLCAEQKLDPECGLLKGVKPDAGCDVRNTLLFKGAADAAAFLAEKLAQPPEERAHYLDLSERLADSVNLMWDDRHLAYHSKLDSNGEKCGGFSVETSMLALLFDVIPDSLRVSCCSNTVSPRSGLTQPEDPLFFSFWCKTLEKEVRPELLLEAIRNGAFPEHHVMLSALMLYQLIRITAGIRVEDRCRKVTVSPRVEGLSHASGTRWTPWGPVTVRWQKLPEQVLRIEVEHPSEVAAVLEENNSMYDHTVQFFTIVSNRV